jgi:CBS-domain-containing membrane protein
MTKQICSCRGDESLAVAARQLWDRDCGSMPVVDDRGHVRGMITDRDICMAALTTGRPLTELRVRDAMGKDVATTRPGDSLHEAEMIMRSRRVRRLPVLDEQNRVIGILSCNDLVRWVDDGGANGSTSHDAVHLMRTMATVGQSPHETRVHPDDAARLAPLSPPERNGASAQPVVATARFDRAIVSHPISQPTR